MVVWKPQKFKTNLSNKLHDIEIEDTGSTILNLKIIFQVILIGLIVYIIKIMKEVLQL